MCLPARLCECVSVECRALLKFCFPVHSLLFLKKNKKISSTSLFGRTQYAEVVTDLVWVKRVPVERRIALASQQTCKAFRERGSLCEAKKESFFFIKSKLTFFTNWTAAPPSIFPKHVCAWLFEPPVSLEYNR